MVGFTEIENKNVESFVVSASFIKEDKHSTGGRLKKCVCANLNIMELYRRICLILFGTLMSSCYLLCVSKLHSES